MANIDDELALFESEISSLVSDAPSTQSVPTTSSNVIVEGKPMMAGPSSSAPSSQPTLSAPAVLSAPPVLNLKPGLVPPPFVPPHVMRPPGMLPPPMPPPGMFPGLPAGINPFVPHQLRMAPAPRPSATFESAPAIYKDEAAGQSNTAAPQVKALAADVLAMEAKKSADTAAKAAVGSLGKAEKEKKPKKYIRCGGGQVWEDPSLKEWDPNDYRIFCGDLGNEVSDELLAKAFRKYPSFQKAKVVRDGRSNKSKGYGFVSFKDADDYARAMREMDGKYVGNRPIKLRKSNWKDRQLDVIKRKQKQKEKLGLWS